jgi:tRNA1Val (adenine37-N6)-methyltransferase
MLTLDYLLDVRLYQHKTGYRVSTDAVLLYSFVTLPRVKNIADLGAGSGVIGLLLAKKYSGARITLIELQEGLAALAEKNIALNGLAERVGVINTDVKKLSRANSPVPHHTCDLVVSNPPFRKVKTGKVSLVDERAVARHELYLPLSDLAKAASTLLKHHGRFCFIHLPERLADIAEALRKHGIELKRLRFVHSRQGTGAKMVLVEAVKEGRPGLEVEPPLFMYTDDRTYTEEVRAIYARESSSAMDD